ncbi:MAG: hypothetical protein R3C56_25910 [Pirellulaceae bacterium]
MLRQGWKDWVDDGCPSLSDNPELRTKYKFDDRGGDSYVRVSWDQVSKYIAEGLHAVAGTYSGPAGAERLLKDGYEPLMVDMVEGAGTRVFKFGSNLPIHGLIGKFGIYRFANLLALLDHHGPVSPLIKLAADGTGASIPGVAIRPPDSHSYMGCKPPTWTSTTCGLANW